MPTGCRRRTRSTLVEDDVPERAAEVDGVDLAGVGLTEAGEVPAERRDVRARVAAGRCAPERPRLTAGVVGEDVETVRERVARPVVGVAADDGLSVVGVVVDADRPPHRAARAT